MLKSNKIVYAESSDGDIIIKKIVSSELSGYISPIKDYRKVKVKNVKQIDNQPVYDISVNHNKNLFVDDLLVHNCFEISFIPITDDGVCGVQFCNLSSVNGALIKSIDDWKIAVEAATIIGTLQAGYTQFPYLSKAAQILTEQEALLGVSLTGWFDSPDILFDEKNQYMMAKLSGLINRDWSKKIAINPAARITCVKPEGTSSIFLGCSSGIHPHHSLQYFRRVQMNKIDPVYKYVKKLNPHATEESLWSANKTDDIITFPITVPDGSITKNQISAIDHLNYVRKTQENWVNPGTTEFNKKPITHNVSCTIEVEDTEWDDVINYLYENRNSFAAVSLLPKMGDKMFRQAPLERVSDDDTLRWENLVNNWKSVDYSQLMENEDKTTLADTVACGGGVCDLPY